MASETFRTPRASAAAIAAAHSRRYTAASGSIPRSVLGMTASPRDLSARESSQSSHFAEMYGRSQATIKFQRECVAVRAAAIPARGPRPGLSGPS